MWTRTLTISKGVAAVAATAVFGILVPIVPGSASAAEKPVAASSQGTTYEKLRINVPEGVRPAMYVETVVGSYTLSWARAVGMRALYQNETSLSPSEREAMRSTMTVGFSTRFAPSATVASDPGAKQPLEFSDQKPSPEWYANIANWKTWKGYTERERLLMEFTRRFAFGSKNLNADDAFWERLHKNFSEREIVDMSIMVANWTGAFFAAEVLGLRAPRTPVPSSVSTPSAVGAITKTMLDAVEGRSDRTVRMQNVK